MKSINQDEPGWYLRQLIRSISGSHQLGCFTVGTKRWDIELLYDQLEELIQDGAE